MMDGTAGHLLVNLLVTSSLTYAPKIPLSSYNGLLLGPVNLLFSSSERTQITIGTFNLKDLKNVLITKSTFIG